MSNENEETMSFDEWSDLFSDHAKSLGYNGSIKKELFEGDYQAGLEPEVSAAAFVDKMNNDPQIS